MSGSGIYAGTTVDELAGPGAPPMANGELIFDAPWQSRVFGMARVLCESGLYDWDEFRAVLIEHIRGWEAAHPNQPYAYFDIFLQTLTALLDARQLCSTDELAALQQVFAERPHGHDH